MFDFIKSSAMDDYIYENAAGSISDDAIRDKFLDDDPEVAAIGAENDPEVDKMVSKVPDDLDASDAEINKAIEGLTGNDYASDITGQDEYEDEIDDEINSSDYQETIEGVTGDDYASDITGQDEYQDELDDEISSGDYQETIEGLDEFNDYISEGDTGNDYASDITGKDEYEDEIDDEINSGDYQETIEGLDEFDEF